MTRACANTRSVSRALTALGLLAAFGCAGRTLPPSPQVVDAARGASTYSARLRVSLRGPELRARTAALVAFERPDALRIEIPGPTGARLAAVVRDGRLVAVFPGDRAFFEGSATEGELESLLGIKLTPAEVMDVLVGSGSPRLRAYDVRWGPTLPREVKAVLPDGAQLTLRVEEAEAGLALPAQAFTVPPHAGYRALEREEARSLWSRR
jgi:hypothetical protein